MTNQFVCFSEDTIIDIHKDLVGYSRGQVIVK